MIMKVKEPIEKEWPHMRQGQLIFTYFHFAAAKKLTTAPPQEWRRCASPTKDGRAALTGATAAHAHVGGSPGGMAVQEGAKYLEKRTAAAVCCSAGVRVCRQAKSSPRRRHRRINAARWRVGWAQGHDPRPVAGAASLSVPTSCRPLRDDPIPNRHNILEQIETADSWWVAC